MGSPNANVKLREMRAMLKDAGFESVRQVGSHESWKAPDGAETVVLACHGGEVGERNVSVLRKAIARAEARRLEIDAARDRRDRMRAAAANLREGVEGLKVVEGFERAQPGEAVGSPWAVSITIPEGSPVEIVFVEGTGRTRRLFGSPELTRANLFTFIADKEWQRGVWPTIFETAQRGRKRPIGVVVRVWRDDGSGTIDVFWLDMNDTQKLGNGQVGVGLALVYSGPPVPKPNDVTYDDPQVRLTYDRDEGGTWAPGLSYRFRWTALGPHDGFLWHGWATQAEAEAAAEDAWLALAEELATATTDDTTPLPPEPGESPTPTTLDEPEPLEPDMPRHTTTSNLRNADEVIEPFEDRILTLLKALDTPAVRAVTGQAVTFDRVLEIVLERGIAAIESDLKGNG